MTTARKSRTVLLACAAVGLPLLAAFATAEAVLRMLPVQSSLRTDPVTESDPVFRARPDTRFVFSRGWNFRIANAGRTNNDGFVNDRDYVAEGPRPLIAVVGDSYIEAKMVPFGQTLQGRLAAALENRGRVYSFAFSGAPLSQYLVWADYARRAYRPDALIVAVEANDFDESLVRYGQGPGFHRYAEDENGELELKLVPYEPGLLRAVAHHSALVRYLVFHLEAGEAWGRMKSRLGARLAGRGQAGPLYVGNTAAEPGGERVALSRRAVDTFFRDLPPRAGLPPERILFLVDGLREAIYEPRRRASHERSYFGIMRAAFMWKARAEGYAVLDLDQAFAADYARNGRRFEYDVDYHWSGYGHGVAAAAVIASDWYARVIAGP